MPVRALLLRELVRLLRLEDEGTLGAMEARALIEQLDGERARFVRMARSRVATEADAEDLVQRAMMRASERAAQLTDGGRARAWFYRILRRLIVDHHRTPTLELGDADLEAEPVAEDAGPRAAACRCAWTLLAEMRPAYAEVLRRIDQEAEDPAAVAAALGVSVPSLYVRLHRARRALREQVKGHCGVSSMTPCLDCTCHELRRCGDGP